MSLSNLGQGPLFSSLTGVTEPSAFDGPSDDESILDKPSNSPETPQEGAQAASGAAGMQDDYVSRLMRTASAGGSLLALGRSVMSSVVPSAAAGSAAEMALFNKVPFEAIGVGGIGLTSAGPLVTSSFGTPMTAAAAAGGSGLASAAFGPASFVFGNILKAIIGGSGTKPRAQFVTQPKGMTGGFEDNVFVETELGVVGLGGKSHKVDAGQAREMLNVFKNIDDHLASKIGPVAVDSIQRGTLGFWDGETRGYASDNIDPRHLVTNRYKLFLVDASPYSVEAKQALENVEKLESFYASAESYLQTDWGKQYQEELKDLNSPYSRKVLIEQQDLNPYGDDAGVTLQPTVNEGGWELFVKDNIEEIVAGYKENSNAIPEDEFRQLVLDGAKAYTDWERKQYPIDDSRADFAFEHGGVTPNMFPRDIPKLPGVASIDEWLVAMMGGLEGKVLGDDLSLKDPTTPVAGLHDKYGSKEELYSKPTTEKEDWYSNQTNQKEEFYLGDRRNGDNTNYELTATINALTPQGMIGD